MLLLQACNGKLGLDRNQAGLWAPGLFPTALSDVIGLTWGALRLWAASPITYHRLFSLDLGAPQRHPYAYELHMYAVSR